MIGRAAQYAMQNFPALAIKPVSTTLPGRRASRRRRGDLANRPGAGLDVLLVGMGNPRQERWIQQHRHRWHVPLCVGIGGLFDFLGQTVSRAPRRLRSAGTSGYGVWPAQPAREGSPLPVGQSAVPGRALCEAWQSRERGSSRLRVVPFREVVKCLQVLALTSPVLGREDHWQSQCHTPA